VGLFSPSDPPLIEGGLYNITGKIVSMDDSVAVGDSYRISTYDIVIDADNTTPMPLAPEGLYTPMQPCVVIAGAVCAVLFS
jgi:hypothetical protein